MNPASASEPLLSGARGLVLDHICTRFETAWRTGRPHIEDYLPEVDTPQEQAALVQELILLDIYHRRRHGETPHHPGL